MGAGTTGGMTGGGEPDVAMMDVTVADTAAGEGGRMMIEEREFEGSVTCGTLSCDLRATKSSEPEGDK